MTTTDSDRVKVYGTDWCEVTRGTRGHLEQIGVPYRYMNIEKDADAAQWLRDQNDGMELKPTLDIEGEVLTAPQNPVLDDVLQRHNILQ